MKALALLCVASAAFAGGSKVANAQTCKPNATPSFEFQVQQPAKFIGDTAARPRPAVQRSPVTAGFVVQFVVDTLGLVRDGTLRILKSPSPEASAAVSSAYASWKYMPALNDGCKVVQLVQTEVAR
ncbi:MAG TPA: hypothetical protein VGQ30_15365 [Gemmatimonadaceae bacterium]|jgi:hypothetical protein|nr:hypothetical protein [Gemmatimonadaceae bacterium]